MANVFKLYCKRCTESKLSHDHICNDRDIMFYENHLLFRSDLRQKIIGKHLIQFESKTNKYVPYYYECSKCKNKVAMGVLPDQNNTNSLQIAVNVRDFNFIDITTNKMLLSISNLLEKQKKRNKKFKLKPKHLKPLKEFANIKVVTLR
eukprot:235031_1